MLDVNGTDVDSAESVLAAVDDLERGIRGLPTDEITAGDQRALRWLANARECARRSPRAAYRHLLRADEQAGTS